MYWTLPNLPPKYRSSLHAIQLALLCKTTVVKENVYDEVLQPLIKDLVSLEEHGVYIERLGVSIKGTVLYFAADNLAAHGLAGFQESFTVERVCRFCMAKREEIQEIEVGSGYYTLRNEEEHNRQVEGAVIWCQKGMCSFKESSVFSCCTWIPSRHTA